MTAEQKERLDAVYRATTYFVDGPSGRFALRIGQASADIDALTAAHHVNTWTYITAHNPGSVEAPSEQNDKQQRDLKKSIEESYYPIYSGEGKGDSGWPAEPSLLVLGISDADAAAMARRFGQAAVLFGERGGPAQLLWTDA
jgi:Protein of unknown function (DUF3293)